MMDKSREQFEAWLESEDGKALMAYSDNHTIAEAAWQASRSTMTPDYTHYECPGCGAAYLNPHVRCDCGNDEPFMKYEYVQVVKQ